MVASFRIDGVSISVRSPLYKIPAAETGNQCKRDFQTSPNRLHDTCGEEASQVAIDDGSKRHLGDVPSPLGRH
ncbi:hypothetical protein LSAT2_028925 [Lamellibrachia satsuma]|nr:hypothetical protein LSAT2_028925 [Lamellibrachia satsuma]